MRLTKMVFKKIKVVWKVSPIKFKRGFSIPSSILGFSLVTISALGLVNYMGRFQKVKQVYEQQSQQPYDHIALMGGMRNIILQTDLKIDSSGNADSVGGEEGFCSVVRKAYHGLGSRFDELLGTMVQPIQVSKIHFTNAYGEMLSDERWKHFVGNEWELKNDSDCSENTGFIGDFGGSPNEKCFKSADQDIYARLSIWPFQIDNSPIEDDMAVDQVKFKIKSVISRKVIDSGASGEYTWSTSVQGAPLYAMQVPRCAVCSGSGTCKFIVLSSSTLGSLQSRGLVYNSPYATGDICAAEALEVSHVTKNVLQESGARNDGIISSNTANGVALSCVTNTFQCNRDLAFKPENFNPRFNLNFGLNLNHLSNTSIQSIGLKFKNGSDELVPDVSKNKLSMVSGGLVSHQSSWNNLAIPLKSGGNNFTYHISKDTAGSEDATVCKTICDNSGDYTPELTVQLNNCFSGQTFELSDATASCTVCASKNCYQYGGQTHQAYNGVFPEEPLDATVPECALLDTGTHENTGVLIDDPSSISAEQQTFVLNNSGKLEAGTGNSQTVCFTYGQWVSVDGIQGSSTCYKSSKQKIKTGQPHNSVYTSGLLANLSVAYQKEGASALGANRHLASSSLPSATDTMSPEYIKTALQNAGLVEKTITFYGQNNERGYEFFNLANQGIFYTPLNKLSSVTGSDLLVNFQTDGGNVFHGGWMSLPEEDDIDDLPSFGFFYREPASRGDSTLRAKHRPARPMFVKMDRPSDFNSEGVGTRNSRLLLTHSLLAKGLRMVSPSATDNYPFLCKNKNPSSVKDIFKAVQSSDPNNPSCPDGYAYLPPVNHKEWLSALHAVAPNHPRYSFPSVFSFTDGSPIGLVGVEEYNYLSPSKCGISNTAHRDDLFLLTSSDQVVDIHDSDCKEDSALSPIRSAWVALEPRVDTPSWNKVADWTYNLPTSDYPAESVYKVEETDTPHPYDVAMDVDDDGSHIGILNYQGIPVPRKELRKEDCDDCESVASVNHFVKPCRYNNKTTDPTKFNRMAYFVGGADQPNWGCEEREGGTVIKEVMDKADFAQARESIYNMGHYIHTPEVTGKFMVLDEEKFCDAWELEELRRQATRYIIDEYEKKHTDIERLRKDYIEAQKNIKCTEANLGLSAECGDRLETALKICEARYSACVGPDCSTPSDNCGSCEAHITEGEFGPGKFGIDYHFQSCDPAGTKKKWEDCQCGDPEARPFVESTVDGCNCQNIHKVYSDCNSKRKEAYDRCIECKSCKSTREKCESTRDGTCKRNARKKFEGDQRTKCAFQASETECERLYDNAKNSPIEWKKTKITLLEFKFGGNDSFVAGFTDTGVINDSAEAPVNVGNRQHTIDFNSAPPDSNRLNKIWSLGQINPHIFIDSESIGAVSSSGTNTGEVGVIDDGEPSNSFSKNTICVGLEDAVEVELGCLGRVSELHNLETEPMCKKNGSKRSETTLGTPTIQNWPF